MKKKIIKEVACDNISIYDLEGPIDEIIVFVEELQAQYEDKGYEALELEAGVDYNDFARFRLVGRRQETDKEYEQRMKQNKKTCELRKEKKAEAAEKEKALYEKLKKRYEE